MSDLSTPLRPLADYELAEIQEYLLRGEAPIDPIDTLLRLIDTVAVLEDRLKELEAGLLHDPDDTVALTLDHVDWQSPLGAPAMNWPMFIVCFLLIVPWSVRDAWRQGKVSAEVSKRLEPHRLDWFR